MTACEFTTRPHTRYVPGRGRRHARDEAWFGCELEVDNETPCPREFVKACSGKEHPSDDVLKGDVGGGTGGGPRHGERGANETFSTTTT